MEIILRERVSRVGKTYCQRTKHLPQKVPVPHPPPATHVASAWSDPAHLPLVSIHSRSYRERRGCAFLRREKREILVVDVSKTIK